MSVRTIKRDGRIVGFQAVAGAGRGPGTTRYFSVRAHGGEALACAAAAQASAEMAASWPARVYRAAGRNTDGIPGLRLQWRDTANGPVIYAVASWEASGRAMQRQASTQRHGMLGAVERVMRCREKGIGRSLGLTPRQALARMRRGLK